MEEGNEEDEGEGEREGKEEGRVTYLSPFSSFFSLFGLTLSCSISSRRNLSLLSSALWYSRREKQKL